LSGRAEFIGLLRRHFFLTAALVVLALMVVVAGWKLTLGKSAPQGGPGGPPAASQARGPGGPGGPGGGRGGRGGGFGGPTQVTATVVQQRAFTDALEVLGVAKGRQSVTLTAATTQLVDKVRFKDGQSVRKGAVLIELKNTEQDAGLAQAEAQLNAAQHIYQRYETLAQQGWASKSQLDQYEGAYKSAVANVNAAKARQADRLILAPFAGVVGLSDVAPGALVNPGAPIVTLDDVSTIRVDFQVPEQYLSMIRAGQPIDGAVDAYDGQKIRGRIAQLDSRVDERTRSITARAEFPNPGARLKPGMLIRVSISRGQRTALAVPESAVSVQGDSAFVFMIRAQGPRTVAEQRPIVTGLRQDDVVEVLDGVQPGDRIVADGLNRLQPGQPVRVTGAPGGHGGPLGGPGGPGGPHGGPGGFRGPPGAGPAGAAAGQGPPARWPRPGAGQPAQ
jgi:membrane fusion protein (multidrug efflux system)